MTRVAPNRNRLAMVKLMVDNGSDIHIRRHILSICSLTEASRSLTGGFRGARCVYLRALERLARLKNAFAAQHIKHRLD